MDELAKRRALMKNDCREWSALDALEDLVAAIKNGQTNPKEIAIHWFEEKEDGGMQHHFQCAGLTYSSHLALLNVALIRIIEDWMA